MADDWLTYEQAAERLGVSAEAARQKAIRGRWQRTKGNDGKARVRLPDGPADAVRTPSEHPNKRPVRTPSEQAYATKLISALEAHVDTLKAELGVERERLEQERARADQAVANFTRLSAELAALRARHWWRRLVG